MYILPRYRQDLSRYFRFCFPNVFLPSSSYISLPSSQPQNNRSQDQRLASVVDSVTIDVSTINTIEVLNIQNIDLFPNPSKGQTTLTYDLTKSGEVLIEVYNLLGQQVSTLVNERQTSGKYQYQLKETLEQGKGVYFVRLKIDNQIVTKKVIVQ